MTRLPAFYRESRTTTLRTADVQQALAHYRRVRQAGGSYTIAAYRRDIDPLGEPIDVLRHRLHVVDERAMIRLVNVLVTAGYTTHVAWQPCQFPAQETSHV